MPIVKSAGRALRFLELLAVNKNGLSFTDIQQKLASPKSSTYSLIQEFLDQDYLTYSPISKKYYAGMELIKLCANCINSTDLLQELGILTSELSQESGQTCHAGVLDSHSIIYLAKYEINKELSLMKNIGLRIPAHCTAIGKMLLSQYSNAEILLLYQDYILQKYTEHSITDINILVSELELARSRDYATELRETTLLTSCISMPIYQNNKMIAAFSLTLPAYSFEHLDISDLLLIMRKYRKIAESRLFLL